MKNCIYGGLTMFLCFFGLANFHFIHTARADQASGIALSAEEATRYQDLMKFISAEYLIHSDKTQADLDQFTSKDPAERRLAMARTLFDSD